MTIEFILGFLVFSLCAGALLTRQAVLKRQKQLLAERLSPFFAKIETFDPSETTLIKEAALDGMFSFLAPSRARKRLELLFKQAGLPGGISSFVGATFLLLATPIGIVLCLDMQLILGIGIGALLGSLPLLALTMKRSAFRKKFTLQLPDAIDLMVSVLRSGHSIPQAVKTVAEEIADPCGAEFKEILHRMNLGQPLSEAITYSCEKFQSYELDLIRRAVAIQAQVGGSLSELLDKTNTTLRQRLKLVQQVSVLTAQSRLTAIIVGLLPIVVVAGLNFMSPGYLNPLLDSSFGNTLLGVAIFLQVSGLLVMKKMSTVKI
jgi:tight adherence protein B